MSHLHQEHDLRVRAEAVRQGLLGVCVARQKQSKAAEPLMVEGVEGLLDRRKQIPLRAIKILPAALDEIVQLYEQLGKPDLAAKWRQRRDQL